MLSVKKITAVMFCLSVVVFCSTSAFATQYTLGISISGLETCNLAGFDLDVEYNTDDLSVVSYALGTQLGSLEGAFPDADNWSLEDYEIGTFNLCEISYLYDFSFQSDEFLLATITFESSDEDALSGISISYLDLTDELGNDIAFTVSGTSITAVCNAVNAVPEPSTLFLMVFGLLGGLMGFGRKTRN